MPPSLFEWSPYIALLIGVAVGLAVRISARALAGLLAAAILLQVLGWAAFFVAAEAAEQGWSADWQTTLGTGFLRALLTAFPFTVIGAVASAAACYIVQRRRAARVFDGRRLDE